jgi:hypothetical protein
MLAKSTVVLYSSVTVIAVFMNSIKNAPCHQSCRILLALIPVVGQPTLCEVFMKTYHSQEVPVKWPFPATPARGNPHKMTRSSMIADVCLVAVWGALIPGLMWLGVAGGF